MSTETNRAAFAAMPKTAAGLARMSVALVVALFGMLVLAHAAGSDTGTVSVARLCDDRAPCDGLPDAPLSSKILCGLPAAGDGNEPEASALPAQAEDVVPLPDVGSAEPAVYANALQPDGRRNRLVNSRAPPPLG